MKKTLISGSSFATCLGLGLAFFVCVVHPFTDLGLSCKCKCRCANSFCEMIGLMGKKWEFGVKNVEDHDLNPATRNS